MSQDLIRLMHALFQPLEWADAPWKPAADVYRTRRGWLIKYELAGVRPADIELISHGNALTVRGSRRDFVCEKGRRSYSMEIAYNRFERTLELPCDVSRARISTDYRDGMLLVHIQPTEGRP